jgi:hypothetical protein
MADKVIALDDKGDEVEATKVNADGSVTVTLCSPIKVMNEETGELVIRRLQNKHARKATKGGEIDQTKLIAALANIPEPCVDEIDAYDQVRIGRVIAGFTKQPPRPFAE